MIIYFAMIIPVIFSIVLYFGWNRKVVWWEFFIPFVTSLIAIVISKYAIDGINTKDIEYWNSLVIEARYYEAWDEYISDTCTRTTTDADGNTTTETYDCSYVEDYPEYWMVITNSNESIEVTEYTYNYLIKLFKEHPKFVDMHRPYHSYDGDMYYIKWNGNKDQAQPVATQHIYTNKVQAANDVFNFPEVDTSDISFYGLYEYPELKNNFNYTGLLGDASQQVHYELAYWNGIIGPEKECRLWILLYKNKSIQSGILQEALWKGGNKNEVVITIGIDDSTKVQWCYPFTWSEVTGLKTDIKGIVGIGKELDLMTTIKSSTNLIRRKFTRKKFREFDYLTVEPPMWAVILVYVIVLLICIGVSFYVVNNEFEERTYGRMYY